MRPDFARPLIRHALYPLWIAKNRSRRATYLSTFRTSQYWPEENLARLKGELLRRLVRHAYETCPFYRERYEIAGVRPTHLQSVADVSLLPTISKQDIQASRDLMVSRLYDNTTLIRDMTGGSTGSPMSFCYDRDRLDSRVAATQRHNEWAGWHIGDRAAMLWGAPQDLNKGAPLKNRIRDWILDRRLMLDASSVDDAAMGRFADMLKKYQPTVIQAYANTMGLFAQFVADRRIEGIAPNAIVCSAEVLTSETRALIESVFRCPVFNRYGSREFAVIASECEQHSGLHVNDENLLVEALVNGVPAEEETGEIVITDLRNLAMPLIRYRIGDVGVMLRSRCACGRTLRLMRLAGGRTTDFLEATNGQKVSGVVIATYVITNLPGIRQIQFVQERRGHIVVRLSKAPDYSRTTLAELELRLKQYLGDSMRIEFDFVDSIPLTASGKYLFSISRLQ